MGNGKTLWEMLVEAFSGPTEFKFYNPLRARIGNAVSISDVELRDFNFFLREIREYKRRIGRKNFFFADYVILARPLNADELLLRLRLTPVEERHAADSELSHDVLLLRLDDEFKYDKEFHSILTDESQKFEVREHDEVVAEYWRINDVTSPYQAKVSVIQDTNKNRRAEMNEVEKLELEYWDYWRESKAEGDVAQTEFLFVEMDSESGWFQIWKGLSIDPKRVMVM